MQRAEQRFVEDRRARRLRHRGIRAAPTGARIRLRNVLLRIAHPDRGRIETSLERFTYVEHVCTIGIADGERATAVLPHYERTPMTIFCYCFGIAMSLATAIAAGNAWTRDHRRGVWTIKMAVTLVVTAILIGIVIGWSLTQYLAFVAASATGRM